MLCSAANIQRHHDTAAATAAVAAAMALPSWDIHDNMFDLITDEKLLEWEVCLARLRESDDKKSREEAANRLKVCVARLARELSTESFEKFETQLQQRVFDLLNEDVSVQSSSSASGQPWGEKVEEEYSSTHKLSTKSLVLQQV